MGRDFVAKSKAVIEHAEANCEKALGLGSFREIKCEFVEIVVDEMFLAPNCFPGFVNGFFGSTDDGEIVAKGGRVFKFKSETRAA